MKRNGTLTTHGREWPLYERMTTETKTIDGVTRERQVMICELSPEDQAEVEALDLQVLKDSEQLPTW